MIIAGKQHVQIKGLGICFDNSRRPREQEGAKGPKEDIRVAGCGVGEGAACEVSAWVARNESAGLSA